MAATTPKAPSAAHAIGAAVLVVLLGILLAAAPRSAPPAIAQIAPNAVQQIKEAPKEQALPDEGAGEGKGADGKGTGEGGPTDGSDPGTGPSAGATPRVDPSSGRVEPRTKTCVGGRQIEDPQSPPCSPIFTGKNGGGTSPGVTSDTIRIALPDKDINTVYLKALISFFNDRFEFYGRRLEVKVIPGYNTDQGCDPAKQSAAAATARDQLDVFASFDTSGCGGLYYAREAARQKIVMSNMQPLYDEKELRGLHPYVWSYPMSGDRLYAAMGRFTCQRLVGSPVSFSGDPSLRGQKRKFGVLLANTVRPTPADFEPLLSALRACGADLDEADIRRIELGSDNDAPQSVARDVILRWKLSEVNTVLVLSHAQFSSQTLFPAATAGGLLPEWVVSDYWEQDKLAIQHQRPSSQQGAMIGITVKPPQHLIADDPGVFAVQSVDPSLMSQTDQDTSIARQEFIARLYKQLLLLSSGIQAAGPTLNPERFARGLETLRFPNPATPLNEGLVGFAASHSMTLDFSEMYYDTTVRGPFKGDVPGAWCLIDRGARRTPATIPKGDAPFATRGKCKVAVG